MSYCLLCHRWCTNTVCCDIEECTINCAIKDLLCHYGFSSFHGLQTVWSTMAHHGRFAACCCMEIYCMLCMECLLSAYLDQAKSVITACLHFSQVFWLLSTVTWIIYAMLFQGECGMENHVMQYGGLKSVASCCSMDVTYCRIHHHDHRMSTG